MARLDIRLTDSQKLELERRADAEGKSLSEFARSTLLGPSAGGVAARVDGLANAVEDLERRLSRSEEAYERSAEGF